MTDEATAPDGGRTDPTDGDAADDGSVAGRAVRAVTTAFWNHDYRRLRAPWRLLGGLVVLAVVGFLAGAVALLVGAGALVASGAAPDLTDAGGVGAQLVSSGILTASTAALVVVGAVALDRRRVTDYGLGLDRDWAVDAGFGLLVGPAVVTGIVAVGAAVGWVTVGDVGGDSGAAVAATVALFVLVGVYEEVLVRGYLLTNLAEALTPLGDRIAVAVATLASSALFGLLHAANPGATALSTATVSLAGVVLATGYLLTGELAIPIGFHVSWNASLGLWGLPVSGVATASVVDVAVDGPTVWTGGPFGPEAGLLGLAALFATVVATVAYVRARTGTARLDPDVVTPDLRWRA